jgi:predicted transcriptional regulator of viral defense system
MDCLSIAKTCHSWYLIGMRFEKLIEVVGDEPVFETDLLFAGDVDPVNAQRQLSRWTRAGRIYQLRRGLYALAPPFQKVKPHPFLVANRMMQPSYVSLQSALAHYGLIPEYVPITTSVTTMRTGRWDTPLGSYAFRHVKHDLFRGYRLLDVTPEQRAFVASPEKALLDLIYLQPNADSLDYLGELRLQNLDQLDMGELERQASRAASPKLCRAAANLARLAQSELMEYETL